MAWLEITGDARLGRCASDNCGGQPVFRLEAYGMGSNYCSGCRIKIEALIKGLDNLASEKRPHHP